MKNDYEKINAAIDYMEKRVEDRKLGVPLTLEAVEAGAQVTFLNNAELPVYFALNGGERIAIPSGSEKSVTLETAGVTADGRPLYAVYFGNRNASRSFFICAATHGREYMTAQLVMKQLEYYCAHYTDGSYNGVPFSTLFQDTLFVIVPKPLNPVPATWRITSCVIVSRGSQAASVVYVLG